MSNADQNAMHRIVGEHGVHAALDMLVEACRFHADVARHTAHPEHGPSWRMKADVLEQIATAYLSKLRAAESAQPRPEKED